MKSWLIVDDSRVVRTIARKIFQELQFATREAGDGQQALDACMQEMPDGILLDWNMPVMDGMQFLKALRRSPGGDQPRVVFCTTENELSRIQNAIEEGADEYIMKPFDSDIIQAKLAQIGML